MEELVKQLKKIVERYNQHEPEWREEIETVKNLPEIKTPELRKILNEAVVVIRQMLKEHPLEEAERELKKVLPEKLEEKTVKFAHRSLKGYYSVSAVRILEKERLEGAISLISLIFNKYILRYEKDFFLFGSEYSLKEEQMKQTADSMDALVSFYIQNHYSRRMIIADLKDETGFMDATIEAIADLIEENYQKLQFNEMLDQLRYLDARVSALES
ncbi:MAG: hypothetical protein HFG42_01525 [Lachnospiraceae bacterium]|nr:hypothetical protein [Lachnospiraceae bacterium]